MTVIEQDMARLGLMHRSFSDRLGHIGNVVIAGGFVRDALMGRPPKDCDVFLLDCDYTDKAQRKQVIDALNPLPTIEQPEWHKSEPYLVTTVDSDGIHCQVMASHYSSVSALLDSFDWNVSLFAFDGAVHARCDVADIAPMKELVLQRVTFAASTLRRGYRFSERFGMRFRHEDVLRLCARVLIPRNFDEAKP